MKGYPKAILLHLANDTKTKVWRFKDISIKLSGWAPGRKSSLIFAVPLPNISRSSANYVRSPKSK